MNPSEHLTRNQIAAFGAGSLGAGESRNIGGHLIRCGECRSLLPFPDLVQVRTALTTDHDFSASRQTGSSELSDFSYSQTVAAFFGRPTRLAWTVGVLTVIVSLAGLFIFTVSNQRETDTEVARSFEVDNPISRPNGNNAGNEMGSGVYTNSKTDADGEVIDSKSRGREMPKSQRKPKAADVTKDNRTTSIVNRNIVATRGATAPCSVGRTIEMELGSQKADLILKWKRVPKAAKYHLYVSDDNEILIDEFETEQETSYVLKTPLNPSKSYKWKIVITLENGDRLYADAQKFSTKDFQSSFNGYKTKARSNTRCLENE